MASQTVALTGQAGFPALQASSNPLDLGGVVVGNSSSVQQLTISNTGTAPLHVLATPTITGANAADFAICVVQVGHCGGQLLIPPSLDSGMSFIVPLQFTPSGAGTRTAQLVFQTDAPGTPQTVQLTGNGLSPNGAGLSMGAAGGSSTSSTVKAGQSANYNLVVFDTASASAVDVLISCNGLPVGASCNATPSPFVLSTGQSQMVAVAITTTPGSSASLLRLGPSLWFLAGFIALVMIQPGRRRVRGLPLGLALVAFSMFLVSCGGGSGAQSGPTPAGTYNIVVTASATSGNNSTSLNLTLVVQ